ncbi:hypothetical protein [Nonomuraea maritima]|uniref:hypothetical protein n=1 Tax=Nonomuraea maritima TaxID=683260 RepID=UPI0037135BB7
MTSPDPDHPATPPDPRDTPTHPQNAQNPHDPHASSSDPGGAPSHPQDLPAGPPAGGGGGGSEGDVLFGGLEAELVALGTLIDVPAPPPADVAAAVRARLDPNTARPDPSAARPDPSAARPSAARPGAARPSGGRGRRLLPRRGPRRRWTVVAAVLVAVVAVTAATPQGREAVVRVLRFAGIELRVEQDTPPPVTTTSALPGEHTVPLTDLRGKPGIKAPSELGPPERATVSDGGRVVSMFWPNGIRFDQLEGVVDPMFVKQLGPRMPVPARVNGRTAWYIPGEHPLGYLRRADGSVLPLRQAGPTLIWNDDTRTFRLEGARTQEEAIRIAGSLR